MILNTQQNHTKQAKQSSEFAHQDFLADVLNGLVLSQKSIPCKWFYDELGSALFEEITKTPEYYPTRVETGLLNSVVTRLNALIPNLNMVIEPGSGASVKTRLLLNAMPALQTYVPMDISAAFLNEIAFTLKKDYPFLSIQPLVGDFTQPLAFDAVIDFESADAASSLVFFPGSTIGNFSPNEAIGLLQNFQALVDASGWLLIGVDCTQNIEQLTAAYNDASGITAQFNKNVLVRANRELQANFDVNQFAHEAIWNGSAGRVEMHLRAIVPQVVQIREHTFIFEKDETIYTESCYKYTHAQFLAMASQSGWQFKELWQDAPESSVFTLFLFQKA